LNTAPSSSQTAYALVAHASTSSTRAFPLPRTNPVCSESPTRPTVPISPACPAISAGARSRDTIASMRPQYQPQLTIALNSRDRFRPPASAHVRAKTSHHPLRASALLKRLMHCARAGRVAPDIGGPSRRYTENCRTIQSLRAICAISLGISAVLQQSHRHPARAAIRFRCTHRQATFAPPVCFVHNASFLQA